MPFNATPLWSTVRTPQSRRCAAMTQFKQMGHGDLHAARVVEQTGSQTAFVQCTAHIRRTSMIRRKSSSDTLVKLRSCSTPALFTRVSILAPFANGVRHHRLHLRDVDDVAAVRDGGTAGPCDLVDHRSCTVTGEGLCVRLAQAAARPSNDGDAAVERCLHVLSSDVRKRRRPAPRHRASHAHRRALQSPATVPPGCGRSSAPAQRMRKSCLSTGAVRVVHSKCTRL